MLYMIYASEGGNVSLYNLSGKQYIIRNVRRYLRGNQKSQIKEGQTTQWPQEQGQTILVSSVFFIMIIIVYKTLHRKLKTEQHDPN